MPDYKKLKVGDKIRLLHVPEGDLKQRKHEIAEGIDDAGWTANTIERIIAQDPIVTIDQISEFGQAWFSYDLIVNDEVERHELALMDDDSWELV